MASLFFSNHEVAIYRMRRIGSTDRASMSATGTVQAVDIVPASDERTEYENSAIGKVYTGYFEVSVNIKEGDEVVIRDSTTLNNKRFAVKGVSHWEGFGNVDCKECVLVAKD